VERRRVFLLSAIFSPRTSNQLTPLSPPTSKMSEPSTSTSGPAGLGVMDSLSAECTPLKHKYDNCFNLWLQDYLQVTPQTQQPPTSKSDNPWSPWSNRDIKADAKGSGEEQRRKRNLQLRKRLDTECGQLFTDYQACVKVSR